MKILICGDSYMSLDKDRIHLNAIHWSNHLGTDVEIVNRARPGASNTTISMQLRKAIKHDRYDAIIIGFTFCNRLEISENWTTAHAPLCDNNQTLLGQLYRQLIWWPAEIARNAAICEYTVLNARAHAPTVFVLNGFQESLANEFRKDRDLFQQVNLLQESMPLQLTGHDEWPVHDEKNDYACFHVRDPEVHKAFGEQILQALFLV